MAQRQFGFDDERRRSSYNAEIPRADTYRPNEAKDRGRDRDRDRDYDRDRHDDRRSDRRVDDRRENWSSVREHEPRSKVLPPLNTDVPPVNAPSGPRSMVSTSFSKSPAAIHSASPMTQQVKSASDHSAPSVSAAPSPSITHTQIPKAKDPKFQPLVDLVVKICDDAYRRSKIGLERAMKRKELEKREAAAKKWQMEDFPQQHVVQQKLMERDKADLEKIEVTWKQVNSKMTQHIDGLFAAIADIERRAVPECAFTPSLPDPTSTIAALDKRLTAFQTELADAQTKICSLESDQRNSDKLISQLKSECEKANLRADSLKSECEKANEKVNSLETLLQERFKQDIEVNAVIEDVADLKTRSKRHSIEKLKLSENITGLEKRVADLNLLQKDIAKLQKSSTASTENITKLQQTSGSSTERIASMQREIYTLQASFTKLEGRTASASEVEKAIHTTKQLLTESDQAKQSLKEFDCQLNDQKITLQQYKVSHEIIEGLQARILALGNEVSATKVKTEDFDIEQFQLFLDQWAVLDVDQTIEKHEDQLTKLSGQVQELEGLKSITGQSLTHASNNESKEIESLRVSLDQIHQDMSTVNNRLNGVEPFLVALVKETVEEGQDTLAELVDGLSNRLDGAVARVDTLESKGVQARTPAPTPQLDTRSSPAIADSQLVARVKAIEDLKLGDQIVRLSALVSESADSIRENRSISDNEFQKIAGAFLEHVNARVELRSEIIGQLEQHEIQLQNLNSHFNNLNTQAMAQTILRYFDAYTATIGPRIDIADNRLNDVDRRVAGLQSWVEATGSMFQQQSNKRPVSPGTLSHDASKRRRAETNGGHTPAPGVSTSRLYQ